MLLVHWTVYKKPSAIIKSYIFGKLYYLLTSPMFSCKSNTKLASRAKGYLLDDVNVGFRKNFEKSNNKTRYI